MEPFRLTPPREHAFWRLVNALGLDAQANPLTLCRACVASRSDDAEAVGAATEILYRVERKHQPIEFGYRPTGG